MDHPLATLRTVDGRPVLRFERRLNHPPAKVWKAVTDPGEMAHWFPAAVHTELEAGAEMRFSFDDGAEHGEAYTEGRILEFDPPRVYAFRWHDAVYRFELIPDGPGCRLLFSTTLSGTGTHGDLPSVARQAPGWDGCLGMLAARLDGSEAPRLDQAWFLDRAERYVEEFGLGTGEVRDTGEGRLVRFERDLVPPVDTVWATLVEDAEPEPGRPPPLRGTHGYLDAGVITELRRPHVLEYAWLRDGTEAGRVRFELREQEPVGCRLVLTQTLPDGYPPAAVLAAWQVHLELFFAALHGEVRCPWPSERTEELTRRYAGA